MSDSLLQLERDLRNAVLRRSYTEVQTIAGQFCARAAEEWRAFPSEDPRRRSLFDRMQTLLQWAQQMIRVSRAAASDELQRVVLANRYVRTGNATGIRLRLDI